MTHEEIIRMAREAGVEIYPPPHNDVRVCSLKNLERFVALVAAHEREVCAQGVTTMNVGDIVQLDPSIDVFGGCLAVVNEVNDSGRVMAYVQNAGQQGQAYIFLHKGKYEPTGGRAVWVVT
jgi:hypothetical protein